MEAQFAKPRLSDYYRPVIAPKRNMPTICSIWCHCASIFRPKNDLGGFLENVQSNIWFLVKSELQAYTFFQSFIAPFHLPKKHHIRWNFSHLFYLDWINASYSYCIAKETSKVVLRTKDRCTMASYTANCGHISLRSYNRSVIIW
jgi:hypothetical protein